MKFNPLKGIFIGVSLNLLLVGALVWVSILRVRNGEKLAKAESFRNQVDFHLEKTLADITKVQNHARAFAISENQEFLDSKYGNFVFQVEKGINDLNFLFYNNPSQLLAMRELHNQLSKRIQLQNQLIELTKYKGFDEAKRNFNLQQNIKISEKIEEIVSRIKAEEQSTLVGLQTKNARRERVLKVVFFTLFGLSLLVPIAGLVITRNYLGQRNVATSLLERNKLLLQSVIDNTSTPVFIKEISGQYLLVNKQFVSLFGPKGDQMVGKTDYDIFPKEIADDIRENDMKVINANKELRFEEVYPQNSDLRTYIMVKFPISNADGKVYAIGGIATDISEQKIAQGLLEESEGLIQSIFDAAPQAIIMTDSENVIMKWNHTAEKIFKWTAEEAIGKSIFELILPKGSREKGTQLFLETEKSSGNKTVELFAIKKNNIVFEAEIYISAIKIKEKSVIISFISDVTLKKQLEKENRRTKNFLGSVVENIPDMIIVKDSRELRYVSVNKAGEKLLGLTQSEMIGKTDFDFFPKEQAEAFAENDRLALETRELVHIPQEVMMTKYGQKWLQTKKIPIMDERGNPLYLVAISDDITEDIRLAEEKREADKRLYANEQRLELILENIGEGVFVADANKNTLLFNRMAEEILELKETSISSDWSNQYNVYYPDGVTVFPAQDLPTEKALRGYSTSDLVIILEDPETGKRKVVQVSGHPIRDENNYIIAAVTTIRDITRLKETERALEESESNYRKMIGFKSK